MMRPRNSIETVWRQEHGPRSIPRWRNLAAYADWLAAHFDDIAECDDPVVRAETLDFFRRLKEEAAGALDPWPDGRPPWATATSVSPWMSPHAYTKSRVKKKAGRRARVTA